MPDDRDRRSRLVTISASGRQVWEHDAQPKIRAYYESLLGEFSVSDMTHTLHYLLRMLEAMERTDTAQLGNGIPNDNDEP